MKISLETNQSILIISSEKEISHVLTSVLRQEYKVFYFKDVTTAIKYEAPITPDLILLELQDSTTDSRIICQQLKNHFLSSNIPVIFLTNAHDILARSEIYKIGGVDYILQPYQEQEVLKKVKNQLIIQFATDGVEFLEQILEVKIQERTAKLQEYTVQLEQEIKEFQITKKQLLYNTLHDDLTGLPNRTLLISKIDDALQRIKRKSNYSFALLFIDIDRFKSINDNLGHRIGDKLLIAIAKLLSAELRDIDTVARLGGDEFVILLDDICSLEDATYICDRLLTQFRLPIAIEDWTIALSLSIGVAFSSDDDYQEAGEILHHADLAMYSAKKQQQAAYELFQDNMLEAC